MCDQCGFGCCYVFGQKVVYDFQMFVQKWFGFEQFQCLLIQEMMCDQQCLWQVDCVYQCFIVVMVQQIDMQLLFQLVQYGGVDVGILCYGFVQIGLYLLQKVCGQFWYGFFYGCWFQKLVQFKQFIDICCCQGWGDLVVVVIFVDDVVLLQLFYDIVCYCVVDVMMVGYFGFIYLLVCQ